jgi:hypothetical protein
MIPVSYIGGLDGTSPRWCRAFDQGCGGGVQLLGELSPGPVAMFGHEALEPLLRRAQADGRTWYYGDHAYFGRGRFFRCTRNAMQHAGVAGDPDPRRFLSFGIPVKPWRNSGSHIVLCPNSESFLARYGVPNWVDETIAALKAATDRKIVLRWKNDAARRPLAADLVDAWAVVTFTSNSAVEAVLAGVPAFCTAPCAAAAMSGANLQAIEAPVMPNGRLEWAARLANNQWTLEEMAAGQLWRAIGEA